MITISLPVPFLVSTFEMYYSHRQVSWQNGIEKLFDFLHPCPRLELRCPRNEEKSFTFLKSGEILIITNRNEN